MEYKVIFHYKIDNFTKLVQKALNDGYKLQGGVSIGMPPQDIMDTSNKDFHKVFVQAMIKENASVPNTQTIPSNPPTQPYWPNYPWTYPGTVTIPAPPPYNPYTDAYPRIWCEQPTPPNVSTTIKSPPPIPGPDEWEEPMEARIG